MTSYLPHRRGREAWSSLTDGQLTALSLGLESESGFDSIPTIEVIYERADSGAIVCPFPTCRLRRRDPVAMWRHVHFAGHGLSFGVKYPEDVVVCDGESE